MDYERHEDSYWQKQKDRISATARKIAERAAVDPGRVVPDQEDIAIGTGRRLKAAVMFVDVVGFSGRASNTAVEQEQNLRVLNYTFTEMFRIVADYGGVVEKNTGDGLMAYFADGEGDPSAPGCLRAVACALTIDTAHKLMMNPAIVSTNYKPIEFRITIDYGFVTIARVGAPRQFNSIVAVGVTANIASKLGKLADAGEIVIGCDVVFELPEHWRKWVVPIEKKTGFVYHLPDGVVPYPAFLYTGRWTHNDHTR